jgi:hypothetical protein
MLIYTPWSLYVTAGVVLSLLLLLCLFVIVLMGDWSHAPRRVISTMVWCRGRRRYATVRLIERAHFGLTTIDACTLLGPGEHCDQACRSQLAGVVMPPQRAEPSS